MLIDETSITELAELLDVLTERATGWVNVQPEIPPDIEVPSTPGPLAVFSKRGPAVPLATWTAPFEITRPENSRRATRRELAQVGLQHGAAMRAADRLADTGAAVPAGWHVLSDHPKRGFVAVPPPDTDTSAISEWMSASLIEICRVPRSGRLLVQVYEDRP